jgi:hypothetical protein
VDRKAPAWVTEGDPFQKKIEWRCAKYLEMVPGASRTDQLHYATAAKSAPRVPGAREGDRTGGGLILGPASFPRSGLMAR